jgi:uncharacterized protein (TIGR02246 family)
MTQDEKAIRELVQKWMAASAAGDTRAVLNLIADDAVFMVPGREPFGKEVFSAASEGLKQFHMEGTSDIREIQVLGDWAYLRNYIHLTITPVEGGNAVTRSGYTLTILRKKDDGTWVLVRDANLLTTQ